MSVVGKGGGGATGPKDGGGFDKLNFLFMFMLLFGGYMLFLKGPASNSGQLAFRIGVFAVGLVGSVVLLVLRAVRSKSR